MSLKRGGGRRSGGGAVIYRKSQLTIIDFHSSMYPYMHKSMYIRSCLMLGKNTVDNWLAVAAAQGGRVSEKCWE